MILFVIYALAGAAITAIVVRGLIRARERERRDAYFQSGEDDTPNE
jgi:hypothetical protein